MAAKFGAGWSARVSTDAGFPFKLGTELVLAASLQFIAEYQLRGLAGCLREFDFVLAGILTALAGKGFSAWRVAPSSVISDATRGIEDSSWMNLPTNPWQRGKWTMEQRMRCAVQPIPLFFVVGCFSSLFGYGLTAVLSTIRSSLFSFVPETRTVPLIPACLYTGAFLVCFSLPSFQVLQGILEPRVLEPLLEAVNAPSAAKRVGLFVLRTARSLLGSTLAIRGMRLFGLQQLR